MSKTPWSSGEDAVLRALYADTPAATLHVLLGRTERSIYSRAKLLGLKKSAEYLAGPHAMRLTANDSRGKQSRFQKGHRPWNAGMKGWKAGGRSAETRFKHGTVNGKAAWLLQPLGAERISKEGIRQRKVREDGPPQSRWKAVHAILWEEANGPIPAGHIVVFRDRNRQNIQLDNLELITRAENCRRNSIHRYPPELKQAIRRLHKLNRTLAKKADEQEEQALDAT